MSKKELANTPSAEENPLFHDTWKLLKNYRDAVWNLELVVQQVRNSFEIEYGSSIEEFLDSMYLAGADIGGSKLENYARSIERSNKMLNLLNSAVEVLRNKHKHGEQYYWILYYSYLSPQQLQNTEEIIESLRPHIVNISHRTYYRKRPEAVQALSSILWGYTSKDCLEMLNKNNRWHGNGRKSERSGTGLRFTGNFARAIMVMLKIMPYKEYPFHQGNICCCSRCFFYVFRQ